MKFSFFLLLSALLVFPHKLNFTYSQTVPKVTAKPISKIIPAFPFAKGSVWIYEGMNKFTGSEGVKEKSLHVAMEIKNVITEGKNSVAIVENFPPTLCWNEGKIVNAKSLLINIGGKKIYTISDSAEVQNYMADTKKPIQSLIKKAELILDFPLKRGKSFGYYDNVKRTDKYFCWNVEKMQSDKIDNIKGINPNKVYRQAGLFFRTAPDTRSFCFIHGVGISEFKYIHHGTIEELNLRLTEVRLK